ncbi:MAG: DUF389 domain-containing protein [Paracoccaceae bacterium]
MNTTSLSVAKDILKFEGNDRLRYWRRFAMLLSLAVIIATMGLIRNSGAVVIAAMLIAPLMTPILGIASAMVMGWTGRTFRLMLTVLLAAALSVLLAWFLVFAADVPRGILLPDQVLARTDPGIEDLVVALASGVAGAYVQIHRNEVSLLPGAAIGVSLVPPLAAAGILLYFGEPANAYEALLLFVTNLAAIVLSAAVVYIIYSSPATRQRLRTRFKSFSASLSAMLLIFCVVVYQLGKATIERYHEGHLEEKLAAAIVEWAHPVSVELIRLEVKPERKLADIWLIVDLPLDAQNRIGSIADLMPSSLREEPLPRAIEKSLGPGYKVAIRYQTRIAGFIDLATEKTAPAPAVGTVVEE